jgi:recombination protein RecT
MADDKIVRQPSALESRMSMIEASRDKLVQFLSPLGLNADRFLHQVRLALRQQPKLQECDAHSLVESVVKAAELGLDPSGALGSAWIVPFAGKATLIPGYRGLIDLAVRSGQVLGIRAVIVHQKDVFDWQEGRDDRLVHVPYNPPIADWTEDPKELGRVVALDAEGNELDLNPGKMIAAYAVALLKDGAKQCLTLTLRELMARKARSKSARNPKSAWFTDEEMMHRKAPVRSICSLLPLSPERAHLLQKALELDDQDFEEPPELPAAPRKSKLRAAVEPADVVDTTASAAPPEPEPGSGG